MSNIKVFISILAFYVAAQLLCNIVDGNAMYTSANVSDLGSLSSSSVTTSSDTSGAPASYVAPGNNFFTVINKIAFFDYTIFRNVDGTVNDWVILRYFFICIGIALLVDAALVFRQLIAG
jgi:hypothetical protein